MCRRRPLPIAAVAEKAALHAHTGLKNSWLELIRMLPEVLLSASCIAPWLITPRQWPDFCSACSSTNGGPNVSDPAVEASRRKADSLTTWTEMLPEEVWMLCSPL